MPDDAIDLNSDLGECFGRWSLGDDDARARRGHQRQRGLRLPRRRRRARMRADLRAGRASAASSIGAQVGYRDLAGFGRRFIDIDPDELADDVLYQIGALEALARAAGHRVRYVKPHGALYNAVVAPRGAGRGGGRRRSRAYDRRLPVLGLPGSALLRAAPRRPGCPPSARRSPTAPTPPRARWSRAASRARCCTTPPRSPAAVVRDGDRRAGARRRRQPSSRSAPSRSACTATPRARWRWPGAVRDGADGAGVDARALRRDPMRRAAVRRPRAAGRARRRSTRSSLGRRRCGGRACPAWSTSCPPPRPCWSSRTPGAWTPSRCARALGRGRARRRRRAARAAASAVEIPVRYDGPDLADVARLTGLRAARWSRRTPARACGWPSAASPRASATWSAATARLHVPRRDSAAHRGAGRVGRRWPASSAASTRASRPAAGS